MNPTSENEIHQSLKALQEAQTRWQNTLVSERIALLDQCIDTTRACAEALVQAACHAKQIDPKSAAAAEEWFGGPICLTRGLRLQREALEMLSKSGHTGVQLSDLRQRHDGQVIANVFPRSAQDRILYRGFRAEVWQNSSETPQSTYDHLGWIYKTTTAVKTALVLGAGNVFSIGPLDVIYKLFAENRVCLLKMNPVNAYTGPHVIKCLQPLFDAGFLKIAYGGADVGAFLVNHELIDEIHITGSDAVHDAIVWGKTPEEQKSNKANATPKLNKPISSELGCVTPVIIVPGFWSEPELDFQAQNVATMVVNNASFNCNAAKLIVTSAGWPQREAFLKKLENVLGQIPQRFAYYPGSEKKYAEFLSKHPQAKPLGPQPENGKLPWTTIFQVNPANEDIVFRKEAWCGVIAETALPVNESLSFLNEAVSFCNQRVWGTLSASVIIDPRTATSLGAELENAIANLHYGSVVVNHWAALSYAFGQTAWGAFPGHTLANIGSGIGWVHNAYLFKNPQKSVIWGPFFTKPLPPWFATHTNAPSVARKILNWEHRPSWCKIPGIVLSALRK